MASYYHVGNARGTLLTDDFTAPAQSAIRVFTTDLQINPASSPYFGEPNATVDQAWSHLLRCKYEPI